MSTPTPATLAELVATRKVIVCCGAGGVGKTTTSAALGLSAARLGRRVLVLTIDPAKRLAQAMGLSEHMREPAPVSRERLLEAGVTTGSLDAWMLNPGVVFEGIVRRMAPTPEQAERVLASRLYRVLSELISTMQEYTAAEALYELSSSGRYDLVVLDTPPARNALDFLEAPGKLARFLDERILSLFLPSKSSGGGSFFKRATELIGTVLGKLFGAEFFAEVQEFMGAMSGMFGPMRTHAEGVRKLLTSGESTFLLVTSPDQAALADARYFRDRIHQMGLPFAGFVLNRSWVRTDGFVDPAALELEPSAALATGLEKLKVLAQVELARVERDQQLLAQLRAEVPPTAFAVAAPYLGEAIEDLTGIGALARGLTEVAAPAPTSF